MYIKDIIDAIKKKNWAKAIDLCYEYQFFCGAKIRKEGITDEDRFHLFTERTRTEHLINELKRKELDRIAADKLSKEQKRKERSERFKHSKYALSSRFNADDYDAPSELVNLAQSYRHQESQYPEGYWWSKKKFDRYSWWD